MTDPRYGVVTTYVFFLSTTTHGVLTVSGNLKSFEGPVLNCRGGTNHRDLDLNDLVFHEMVLKAVRKKAGLRIP